MFPNSETLHCTSDSEVKEELYVVCGKGTLVCQRKGCKEYSNICGKTKLLNLRYQSSSSGTNPLGSDIVPRYLYVSGLDRIDRITGPGPGFGLRANRMIEPDSHRAVDTCTLQYGHL